MSEYVKPFPTSDRPHFSTRTEFLAKNAAKSVYDLSGWPQDIIVWLHENFNEPWTAITMPNSSILYSSSDDALLFHLTFGDALQFI